MCALKVDPSDPGFASSVLDALSRIAPGYRFWADGKGKVSCSPVFCPLYNRHRAGCNLVAEVLSSSEEIRVLASNNRNGSSFKGQGAEAGTIYWWPGTYNGIDTNECGTGDAPGSVVLAHELIHGLYYLNGRTFSLSSEEEEAACLAENQIRAEVCEPRRISYGSGSNSLAISGRGGLSRKDKEGCGKRRGPGSRAWTQDCERRREEICKVYQAHKDPSRKPLFPPPGPTYTPNVTDPNLLHRFRLANDSRQQSQELAELERYLTRSSLEPVEAQSILVTSAGLAGGSCGFVAIELWRPIAQSSKQRRATLTVTTNFRFGEGERRDGRRRSPERPRLYAVGPDTLTSYVADPQRAQRFTSYFKPVLERFGAEKETNQVLPESLGGDPHVFDGTAEYLTLRRDAEEIVKVGLTGYTFPAFHREWREPPPSEVQDTFRWVAINGAYLLARDLLIQGAPQATTTEG